MLFSLNTYVLIYNKQKVLMNMFSLYSNKKFVKLTEYIPFNQLYYIFYKQKLEKANLKYIQVIKLLKYFIRNTKIMQKLIKKMDIRK